MESFESSRTLGEILDLFYTIVDTKFVWFKYYLSLTVLTSILFLIYLNLYLIYILIYIYIINYDVVI